MALDLRKIFYGRVDEYIDNMTEYKFQGKFIKTREIVIDPQDKHRLCIKLGEDTDFHTNFGYTNLRFEIDFKKCVRIQLEFGGSRVDSIYPSINPNLKTFALLDKNIIPALSKCKYQILLELVHDYDFVLEECVKILYDVVEITNPIEANSMAEFFFNQTLFTGSELVTSGIKYGKFCVGFNHPITKINVFSNSLLTDTHLILETENKTDQNIKLDLDFVGEKNNIFEYAYNFSSSVNFTQVPRAYLWVEVVKPDVDATIDIFGTAINIMTVGHDKVGVRFSK
jgi:hypothetical protein